MWAWHQACGKGFKCSQVPPPLDTPQPEGTGAVLGPQALCPSSQAAPEGALRPQATAEPSALPRTPHGPALAPPHRAAGSVAEPQLQNGTVQSLCSQVPSSTLAPNVQEP